MHGQHITSQIYLNILYGYSSLLKLLFLLVLIQFILDHTYLFMGILSQSWEIHVSHAMLMLFCSLCHDVTLWNSLPTLPLPEAFYWGGGGYICTYEMYFYFAQFVYHLLTSLTSSGKLHGNLSLCTIKFEYVFKYK